MSQLKYTCKGRAQHPPVLFLHGFMGSRADWDEVVEALHARFRCITVDLPGHGASLHLPDPALYTMDGAARALRGLLEALGVRRCAVVGYSMGGRLALYFALHHPAYCSRLVLESASPGLQDAAERQARRGLDEALALRLTTEDLEAFTEAWYRQPLFASLARHEGLLQRMVAARQRNEPQELARVLRGMGTGQQPSLWERLDELEVSTLAIAGALDGKYVEVAEQMAVASDRVRAAVLPNAGHNVHAEYPEVYADLLRDFFKHL